MKFIVLSMCLKFFYVPEIFIGKTSFFNFSIEMCYKTCSQCDNILGNKIKHYCTECSTEYPFQYLNGEKCINSCKDNDLFQYKNECLDKCNDNTFVDELSNICYDNCIENDNSSRLITYNNTCVDECPEGYILNEETNICDKIIIEVYTTNILEEISTLMEISSTEPIFLESTLLQENSNEKINQEILSTLYQENSNEEFTNSEKVEETSNTPGIISTLVDHEIITSIIEDIEQETEKELISYTNIDKNDTSDSEINYYSDEDFTNDSREENNEKEENENTNRLIISELLEIIDESSSEQITEDTIKDDEKSNSINQNNKKKNNCQNLFYIKYNETNCLSNNEKICPEEYPYKSLVDNECQKYSIKYNNNLVNSLPNGTCIDTKYPTLDICIDTNEIINELGGFCIVNKTNIISNIKIISESINNRIELCKGVTFFFYSNKDDINELSKKYQNLTFIDMNKCANDLMKYYKYPKDTKFYILGIDSPNKLSNSSINNYQYYIYNEKGQEMDIRKICNKSDIIMTSPIIKKDLLLQISIIMI